MLSLAYKKYLFYHLKEKKIIINQIIILNLENQINISYIKINLMIIFILKNVNTKLLIINEL